MPHDIRKMRACLHFGLQPKLATFLLKIVISEHSPCDLSQHASSPPGYYSKSEHLHARALTCLRQDFWMAKTCCLEASMQTIYIYQRVTRPLTQGVWAGFKVYGAQHFRRRAMQGMSCFRRP